MSILGSSYMKLFPILFVALPTHPLLAAVLRSSDVQGCLDRPPGWRALAKYLLVIFGRGRQGVLTIQYFCMRSANEKKNVYEMCG